MKEYIIIHDCKDFKDCLYTICGYDKEKAEERLKQILENPDERDKDAIENKGYYNFRVLETNAEDNWWHYGTD